MLATIDDLAREFRIHRKTVYRIVRRQGLTIYRKPGDRRSYVERDDFSQAMEPIPKDGEGGRDS